MKVKKCYIAILVVCLSALSLSARTAVYAGDNYTIELVYNDTVVQGEAIFVRMKMVVSRGYKKAKTAAILELRNKRKKLDSTSFYIVKTGISSIELLAGIPIPEWLESEEYSLSVVYSAFGTDPEEFQLPVTVKQADFEKRVISTDTVAHQDETSPEQLARVKRTDSILQTVNSSDIFQLSEFTPPVDTKRRNSEFGDQLTYTYPSGKLMTDFGNDIEYNVPAGSAVYACGTGKVVLAEKWGQNGWTVIVEHLPGLYSFCSNMNSVAVKEGQTVRQGERIGVSGMNSLKNRPALFWGIILNTVFVNPDFFNSDFAFDQKKK